MDDLTTIPRRPTLDLEQFQSVVSSRLSGLPAWVVMTQLFIGLGWLRAVAEKVIDPNWWTGAVISDFVAEHQDVTLGWYQPFLDNIVLSAAPVIAVIVVIGQLIAGIALTSGRRLGPGIAVGMVLNLSFMAAGAVTPSAFYLLAQGALALWLAERTSTPHRRTWLRSVSTGALFFAALSAPFISTMHPAHVIDDPAVMFVFGGVLAAIACVVAHNSISAPQPSGVVNA